MEIDRQAVISSEGRFKDSEGGMLERILSTPGSRWTQVERDTVVEWLYTEERRAVYSLIAWHLGRNVQPEDVEDVWGWFVERRLSRVMFQYDPDKVPFRQYLQSCLRNFAKDQAKIRSRHSVLIPFPDPSEWHVEIDLATMTATDMVQVRIVEWALSRLPPETSQILVSIDLERYTVREFAERWGLTEPCVNARLLRARQAFRSLVLRGTKEASGE